MNIDDFTRIEHALGLRLPEDYRALLLDYPLPADDGSSSMWLVDDANEVIERTREFRSRPLGKQPWSPDYLYLGHDGGEEVYFLDVRRVPAVVLTYDHEAGDVREQAVSLREWIEDSRREMSVIAADERLLAERFRTKRWWQFWIRPYPRS